VVSGNILMARQIVGFFFDPSGKLTQTEADRNFDGKPDVVNDQ
jgi:hypothetical protein